MIGLHRMQRLREAMEEARRDRVVVSSPHVIQYVTGVVEGMSEIELFGKVKCAIEPVFHITRDGNRQWTDYPLQLQAE